MIYTVGADPSRAVSRYLRDVSAPGPHAFRGMVGHRRRWHGEKAPHAPARYGAPDRQRVTSRRARRGDRHQGAAWSAPARLSTTQCRGDACAARGHGPFGRSRPAVSSLPPLPRLGRGAGGEGGRTERGWGLGAPTRVGLREPVRHPASCGRSAPIAPVPSPAHREECRLSHGTVARATRTAALRPARSGPPDERAPRSSAARRRPWRPARRR